MRKPGQRLTGLPLQLGLDFGLGAGDIPSGQVGGGGPAEGIPCDGERLGDVGGVNYEQDPYRHVIPAAPALGFDANFGHRRILLLGEASLEVTAGVQPTDDSALAGHGEPDLEAHPRDGLQVPGLPLGWTWHAATVTR